MYLQIEAGTFNGQVYFDDLTLLGDVPKVQADFEATGLNGWADAGWNPGLSGVTLIVDPNNAENHVMEIGMDHTLGTGGPDILCANQSEYVGSRDGFPSLGPH